MNLYTGDYMKPTIAITSGRILSNSQILRVCLIDKYVQAIREADGIPVILPPTIDQYDIASIHQKFNGIILTGGGDISIEKYHGSPHAKISDVENDRDNLEIALVKLAFENRKPLFGICRGHQVINVALGGDLYTHIPTQFNQPLKHDHFPNVARDYAAHSIKIEKSSRLVDILYGNELMVNSLHHQAINSLASPLDASAFAPDGMIEAVEIPDYPFFFGVQWHPEWLTNMPAMQNLFSAFVNAARDS